MIRSDSQGTVFLGHGVLGALSTDLNVLFSHPKISVKGGGARVEGMKSFQHPVSLPVGQLLTLLLLAADMMPEEALEARCERAARHLLRQEVYVAEDETRCPHTGQLVRRSPQGQQIRRLLENIAEGGPVPTAQGLAKGMRLLPLQRHLRLGTRKTPTSLMQIFEEGAMLDHVARVVVDLGVGSHPNWTWWDAEVVATSSDGVQWLIQRVRRGARFGGRSEPAQGGYLYGEDDGSPWVLTVPVHVRTMEQAQTALAQARARAVQP
ncbi:hypothetical protein QR90_12775 [Deinococcus radiopugnans]|uniref:Uncharacterized protein n=2 Tax=Deinococcus radiopugnans TaxID=57497 RepID=A0A0A7KI31_9DEIO|nr:hypothetical protein QR90_12775 [Deinococcus radiopugnans]